MPFPLCAKGGGPANSAGYTDWIISRMSLEAIRCYTTLLVCTTNIEPARSGPELDSVSPGQSLRLTSIFVFMEMRFSCSTTKRRSFRDARAAPPPGAMPKARNECATADSDVTAPVFRIKRCGRAKRHKGAKVHAALDLQGHLPSLHVTARPMSRNEPHA